MLDQNANLYWRMGGITVGDVEDYLYGILPPRDEVVAEMEDEAAKHNVPIVGLIPLLCFYIYLAVKQARANDQLIEQLEADPAMAKTHHRKTWPFKPGWAKEVHVWPFLLRIEFLAAIIVTIILMIWSMTS